MASTKEIAVIVPTYKPGTYIEDCLYSLARQTLAKDRFLVCIVLNGCCEPWLDYLNGLVGKLKSDHGMDAFILQDDFGNVSNARNIGIDNTDSEYVCFMDDDDYVSPGYLEFLLAKASHDTVPLCRPYAFRDGCGSEIPYRITKDWNRCHMAGKQRFYKPKRFFDGPWMKLIHRSIIGSRRFDTRFRNGEDSIFMFLISDRIRWADFTDDNAVYYRRIRENSAQSLLHDWRKRPKIAWDKTRMYTKYLLKHPLSYSMRFYCSRLLGALGTLKNG